MIAAPYAARIDFVVQLASRLHAYGTTAERLEGAITAVAPRIGLRCAAWSNPTCSSHAFVADQQVT